jgi:hypothetical protein
MDSLEISEKINAQAEDLELSERIRQQTEEINRGAPIPTVSAADMEQLWNATRRINADFPPKPNRSIGMGALAAYGVEAAVNRPEEFFSVSKRYQLLSYLVERGVLNDYKHGEELDERVFSCGCNDAMRHSRLRRDVDADVPCAATNRDRS